jgi:hypothetical protein
MAAQADGSSLTATITEPWSAGVSLAAPVFASVSKMKPIW